MSEPQITLAPVRESQDPAVKTVNENMRRIEEWVKKKAEADKPTWFRNFMFAEL